MKRACGVLLPVSSIPSAYGIGAFSKSAYEFIDKLVEAGQTYWQIVPLGPTGLGDSPYQSFSTFAGNPYYIDLEALVEEGVLTKEECDACDFGDNPGYVDYGKLYNNRFELLHKAYERSNCYQNPGYHKFVQENAHWLQDYALYMAVKKRFGGKGWQEWADDIRLRWNNAMDYYRRECYFDIEFYYYQQFKFMEQWTKLKKYANDKGIRIIGDLPIYVSSDSADAWSHPELFQFDEKGIPTAIAGCPPDAFSATGQLWGNPLYRWDYHKATDYAWWTSRMEHCYKLYDVVRIDHFRGFDEYYSIPYGAATALEGRWVKGPGMDLFRTLERKLGKKDVIAEDLGLITPTVKQLVKDSGFPNMKVLEFAFVPGKDNEYLPHNYDKNCVVYTGTHDNDTLVSWLENLTPAEVKWIRKYTNCGNRPITESYWDMIRLAMMSTADLCIIPVGDYLGLGAEARINHPATMGNWKWRLADNALTDDVIRKMRKLAEISFRTEMTEVSEEEDEEVTETAVKNDIEENAEVKKSVEAAEETKEAAETEIDVEKAEDVDETQEAAETGNRETADDKAAKGLEAMVRAMMKAAETAEATKERVVSVKTGEPVPKKVTPAPAPAVKRNVPHPEGNRAMRRARKKHKKV